MSIAQDKANTKKQIEAMRAKFIAKAQLVGSNKVKAVTNAVLMIEAQAKKNMRDTEVDTSRTTGKRGHHPSKPGFAPAPDSGTMIRSVAHDVKIKGRRVVGRVGSKLKNPPYPAYLEHGTSTIQPRPWLITAVKLLRDKISTMFRKIYTDDIPEITIQSEVE